MVTMTERLERKVKRQKRQELLIEQTAIREKHCVGCSLRFETSVSKCQECPAFVELERIGNELLNMSRKKRKVRKQWWIKNIEEFGLTMAMYTQLKTEEFSDKEIAEYAGVSLTALVKWRGVNNEVFSMDLAEYEKAKSQGISDEVIADRHGVTVETLRRWKKDCEVEIKKSPRYQGDEIYELYRKHEIVATGTMNQIIAETGLSINTLRRYRAASHLAIALTEGANYSYLLLKEETTC